jgi:predicted ATP-dependent endonuclease of OLD family
MRLVRARVRDYRSIHDSGEIEIEEHKTLFVGVNEAGKTVLLKALQQIQAPSGTETFSALKDYPRSRYTEVQRGDRDPSDVTVAQVESACARRSEKVAGDLMPGVDSLSEFG